MRNIDELLAMSQGEITLDQNKETGQTFLIQNIPSEEVLESAAARVRPLLLERDPVYWNKVVNSLGYLLRDNDDPEIRDFLTSIKQRWKDRVENAPGQVRGYMVQVVRANTAPPSTMTASDLGMTWFYGDVVHADADRRQAGADYGIKERYRAAVLLITNALVANRMTLRFVSDLQKSGHLNLDKEVFEEEVVVLGTQLRSEVDAYAAPRDVAMPTEFLNSIPDGFERVDLAEHAKGRGILNEPKSGPIQSSE